MKRVMIFLLIVLISCFSCSNLQVKQFKIPTPPKPVYEKVEWEKVDSDSYQLSEGLFIKYNEYRKLERNIIEMRAYIEKLEKIIEIYNEDNKK